MGDKSIGQMMDTLHRISILAASFDQYATQNQIDKQHCGFFHQFIAEHKSYSIVHQIVLNFILFGLLFSPRSFYIPPPIIPFSLPQSLCLNSVHSFLFILILFARPNISNFIASNPLNGNEQCFISQICTFFLFCNHIREF